MDRLEKHLGKEFVKEMGLFAGVLMKCSKSPSGRMMHLADIDSLPEAYGDFVKLAQRYEVTVPNLLRYMAAVGILSLKIAGDEPIVIAAGGSTYQLPDIKTINFRKVLREYLESQPGDS